MSRTRFRVNLQWLWVRIPLLTILSVVLTLPAPCISESCIKITINLNFYFHTSLWCLTKKCENKVNFFSLSEFGAGRVKGLIKHQECSFLRKQVFTKKLHHRYLIESKILL